MDAFFTFSKMGDNYNNDNNSILSFSLPAKQHLHYALLSPFFLSHYYSLTAHKGFHAGKTAKSRSSFNKLKTKIKKEGTCVNPEMGLKMTRLCKSSFAKCTFVWTFTFNYYIIILQYVLQKV